MYPYDENDNKDLNKQENETHSGENGQQPSAPGLGTGAYPYTAQTGGQTQQYSGTGGASYSWGPGYGGQNYPQQPAAAYHQSAYYTQPPKPPKKKGSAGKTVAKVIAGLAACAVVSLSSVGVFAGMIQTGVVNVQSPEGAENTAAFTLYKKDASTSTTPTTTRGEMTTQEVAQKLIPSVVCVQNYQVRQNNNLWEGFGFYTQDQTQEGGKLSPAGEGSGIILSEDGYIVTNQHVVDGATNISVVTSDGVTYEARLVGEDTQTDLAVLKIDTDDTLVPAEFGDSEDLQVTDMVMAIGNPGGLQFNSSVTIGYVSALNRPVTNSETGFMVNCIQTDAAINPGNSGGALVNGDGLVVGINSSKIAATEYEGMGFAIPSSVVQPIVSDLIEHGYVTNRAMLGISCGNIKFIDRTTARYYGLPNGGYPVAAVITENAKSSGLQAYDIITAIDDTQVTSANTIPAYLATKKPGDKVTLTVDRVLSGETGVKIELVLSANTGESN